MLAAVPMQKNTTLDLFCLALSLIRQGDQNIPPTLKAYFDKVVSQAQEIARDPQNLKGQVMPEAIQLAMEMRQENDFSHVVEGISDISVVTPDLANRILNTMEQSFVSTY